MVINLLPIKMSKHQVEKEICLVPQLHKVAISF